MSCMLYAYARTNLAMARCTCKPRVVRVVDYSVYFNTLGSLKYARMLFATCVCTRMYAVLHVHVCRLPMESARKLRWYDKGDTAAIVKTHLREKREMAETLFALKKVEVSRCLYLRHLNRNIAKEQGCLTCLRGGKWWGQAKQVLRRNGQFVLHKPSAFHVEHIFAVFMVLP